MACSSGWTTSTSTRWNCGPTPRLGVPGLLQAIRAGNVLVANAPGSAFLESPALLGFLPGLSRAPAGRRR